MDESECTREFRCADGNTYMAHPRSCFFCDHCIEIIYDFTNGPYMWPCDLCGDTEEGMTGRCNNFKEDSENYDNLVTGE